MKLWLIILFLPFCGYSTHLIGGEMTYRYLGNDTFQIKMTVYRDCANGIAPFDDPASIGIFDSNNSILDTLDIYLTSQTDITNSIYNCLPVAPSTICYQKGEYIFNLFLPPITGSYQIAYQRCCRPASVVNILGPLAGFSLLAKKPDSIWSTNSSPQFNLQPFSFLCVNTPFVFDNSATDIDSDSLVYSLCTPYDGASAANPSPMPPGSPPYADITWLPPYSLTDMMGGSSPLLIDAQTGSLSVTPNAEGIYNYGISVKEYRGGVYIGEIRRDNTLYVINPVGVNELEEASITISPNPFSGKTNIHISEEVNLEDTHIEIIDALGREIINKVINTNDFVLGAELLSPGMYFYRLFSTGSTAVQGRLIVN